MKCGIFIFFLVLPFLVLSQDKLLSKKIVYTIDLTESSVKQEKNKDTIMNTYKVNQRFWWEATDNIFQKWKNYSLLVYDREDKPLVWDSMFVNLGKSLGRYFKRDLKEKEVQAILENNVTKIEFEEEWYYNPYTMMINKNVLSYTLIVSLDSLCLSDEGWQSKNAYIFRLGKIKQNSTTDSNNLILITRNIHYSLPIYNYAPYLWWDSNLEEEYSLPYFDEMMQKAENMEIPVFENPDKIEIMQKHEVLKRRKYTKSTKIVEDLGENMTNEYDTILGLQYNSEDIDHLRFGEEIYFDKTNMGFIKHTNYLSPMISIKDNNDMFLYFYPVYYLRKQ